MKKTLVIVESPAKAKTISKFLGNDYRIIASYGHIRDLPPYTLGVAINNNFEPSYKILKEKNKLLKEFKSLALKAQEILIATDPDREGEAIAWHIKEAMDLSKPTIKRIIFNEITNQAIQDAISKCRDINMNLVNAQQARRILDRLIGYKISPIISKKIRKGLSAGRVQSVALRIICEQEEDIQSFVPKEYWTFEVDLANQNNQTLRLKLFAKNNIKTKLAIQNEAEAQQIAQEIKNRIFQVDKIQNTTITKSAPFPFITSTLQQEASRKLNWSTKKTMLIAQQLYEGIEINDEPIGLITYMRTDSTRISNEAKENAKEYITKAFGPTYTQQKEKKLKKKKNIQDAHEAIRPSYIDKNPISIKKFLSKDHYLLYELIWNRFIASQMSDMQIESTQLIISCNSQKPTYYFKTSAQKTIFEGFSKIYSESKDEPTENESVKSLPQLTLQEKLDFIKDYQEQKFTQPPLRYTEATLIRELEEKGIGRPSTYAPTVSIIQERGYVAKEKKKLYPTELGSLVNTKLIKFFASFIDTKFTANMETKLDEIMEGKHSWQEIVSTYYQPLTDMVKSAYEKMEKVNTDKPSDEICEKCQSPMVIKEGKFGNFLACSNFPNCKHTKSIINTLNIKCPKCHHPLIEKKTKKGKVFYGCSNYPQCTFATWNKPINESCPNCQASIMYLKRLRNGKEIKYCENCHKKDS
jgi:DNA topoisomerase-1